MSLPVKSFYVDEAHNAIKNNEDNSVVFEVKKTYAKNTEYAICKMKVGGSGPVPCNIYFRGARVAMPPADPNDPVMKDIIEGNPNRSRIEISGNESGGYGEFIKDFAEVRRRKIKEMEDKGIVCDWTQGTFCNMYRVKYSKRAGEKAGQAFTDKNGNKDFRVPLILDFSKFPTDNGKIPANLRGRVKTLIKDFRTGRLSKDGKHIEYDLAQVDGEPINAENAHKFITRDSIIEEAYVNFITTSKSMFGISTQQIATELVINPAPDDGGFDSVDKKNNADLFNKIIEQQKDQVDIPQAPESNENSESVEIRENDVTEMAQKLAEQKIKSADAALDGI